MASPVLSRTCSDQFRVQSYTTVILQFETSGNRKFKLSLKAEIGAFPQNNASAILARKMDHQNARTKSMGCFL